jgi:putative endonuclease
VTPIPAPAGIHRGSRAGARQQAHGTLYVGTTSDLARTKRHGVDRLVWFEGQDVPETALRREKQIKECQRDWKINLIERENRHWVDLFPTLTI